MSDFNSEQFLDKILKCPNCKSEDAVKFDHQFKKWICNSCGKRFEGNAKQIITSTANYFEGIEPDEFSTRLNKFSKKQGLLHKLKTKSYRQNCTDYLKKLLANTEKDKLILDFGCGSMTNLPVLVDHKTIYADGGTLPGVNVVANFEKTMPIKDSTFDLVLSLNVLEHLYDPLKYIREAKRMLKPGCKFILVVPYGVGIHSEPLDYYRYTKFFFERSCNDEGFTSVSIKEFGSPIEIHRTLLSTHKNQLKGHIIRGLRNKIEMFFILIQAFLLEYTSRIIFKSNQSLSKFPQGYFVEFTK